ncbi:MAG: hypothetical protein ACI8ZN_000078 [Bacteroidia bacterium]|jgi:hypothetical protein
MKSKISVFTGQAITARARVYGKRKVKKKAKKKARPSKELPSHSCSILSTVYCLCPQAGLEPACGRQARTSFIGPALRSAGPHFVQQAVIKAHVAKF